MSSWLSMLVGNGGPADPNAAAANGAATNNPRDLIARFTDRLAHSTMTDDRRAALLSLKGLVRDFKPDLLELRGVEAIASSLRRDAVAGGGDLDMIRAELEAALALMTPRPKRPAAEEHDLCVQAAEHFADNMANIAAVLDALEELDFHVRFDALQLLAALHRHQPARIVDGVLASPIGVSKLVDLLVESHEAVRTEAILLLVALSESNTELQKIIAFQNAFDLVFGLLLPTPPPPAAPGQPPASHPAPVDMLTACDSLRLLRNLLRLNPANQTLFRESGCIPALVACINQFLPPAEDDSATAVTYGPLAVPPDPFAWAPVSQMACLALLDIVRVLVAPNAPPTRAAQDSLATASILGPLLELSLGAGVPRGVKAAALRTLGECVRGHVPARNLLADSVVYIPVGPHSHETGTKSALLLVVGVAALGVADDDAAMTHPASPIGGVAIPTVTEHELRRAALYALQCFLYNHPDGQLALAMTAVNPPPDEVTPTSAAGHGGGPHGFADQPLAHSIVLPPLIDWQIRDELRTWFAAMIACASLVGSPRAKEVMAAMYAQQVARARRALDVAAAARRQNRRSSLVATGSPLLPGERGHHSPTHGAHHEHDDDNEDDEDEEEESATLAQSIGHTLVFSSRGKANVRVQVALLSVLSCWAWECPQVVGELTADSTIMQFLIEQVTSSIGDGLVEGLAAYLLGACYEFYPSDASNHAGAMSHDELFQVINVRIGVEQMHIKLARLREDPRYMKWTDPDVAMLDEVVVIHINETYSDVQRGLRQSPAARSHSASVAEAQSSRAAQLEARVAELEALHLQEESEIAHLTAVNQALTARVQQAEAVVEAAREENSRCMLWLEDQEAQITRLRARLARYGDESSDSLASEADGSPRVVASSMVPAGSPGVRAGAPAAVVAAARGGGMPHAQQYPQYQQPPVPAQGGMVGARRTVQPPPPPSHMTAVAAARAAAVAPSSLASTTTGSGPASRYTTPPPPLQAPLKSTLTTLTAASGASPMRSPTKTSGTAATRSPIQPSVSSLGLAVGSPPQQPAPTHRVANTPLTRPGQQSPLPPMSVPTATSVLNDVMDI